MNKIQPDQVFRKDSYAENTNFPDRGCEFNPSCLGCPLATCVEDEPNGIIHLRLQHRHEEIIALREVGLPPAVIAAQLHISKRTVFRNTYNPEEARLAAALSRLPTKPVTPARLQSAGRTLMNMTPVDYLVRLRDGYASEEEAAKAHLEAVLSDIRRKREAAELMIEEAKRHPLEESEPTDAASESQPKPAPARVNGRFVKAEAAP